MIVALSLVLVGYLVARGIEAWGRRQFVYLFNDQPVDRAERIFYLLVRALLLLFSTAVMWGTAMLGAVMIQDHDTQRATFLFVITAFTVVRAMRIVFLNILAPDVPSHRLIVFDDETARHLQITLTTVVGLTTTLFMLCWWMETLGLDPNAHLLALMVSKMVAMLLLSTAAVRFRREIGAAIRGGIDTPCTKGMLFLTRIWHVIAVLYFVSAWMVSSARLVLDLPGAYALVASPLVALLGALLAYAVLLLLIDRFLKPAFAAPGQGEGSRDMESTRPALHGVAERGAAVVAWFVAIFILLRFWNIDVSSSGGVLVEGLEVAIVVFLAWFVYRTVEVMINHKIAQEGGIETGELGDEGGGHGGVSRIAMLLSLFRKFLLISILTIAGMIALSHLGLDIAPLFAGAGVVGLAIGFGAQTLIRDIFSGAFFLMDDAFRIGEYIDVGSVKGTVEKISIRSMQLRHHLGALHTIPFGEIKQLTNHSRDWVMMKLKLRVTYDTDIERVRKLIKNLGKKLLDHPEVGDKFMQPLKSQGVYSMEDDSAIIIRVKFMTKPGDQFITRKVVYAAIRELFEEEGIRFASREVTVRVAEENSDPDESVTPERKTLAGAALPAIETANASPTSDDAR